MILNSFTSEHDFMKLQLPENADKH